MMLRFVFQTLRHPLQAVRLPLAALVGTLLAACGSGSPPASPPDQVEPIGALELVTHFRAERGGDAARFAWQHVAHWSLRWRGQPLVIDTLGGMFGDKPMQLTRVNAAFIIVRGEGVPDVLVNVGDPNNTSAFHLVRQQGDAVQVDLLCIISGGDNSVGWAQHLQRHGGSERVAAGLPGRTEWLLGPQKATLFAETSAGTGAGGRYLMLGRRCLFDTTAGTVHWLANNAATLPWGPAIVSPDGTRILRLAQGPTQGEGFGAGPRPLLGVSELLSLPEGEVPGSVAAHQASRQRTGADASQVIELQRERMRFPSLREVDADWVLHHFRWERGALGEMLVERPGFKALAHRGVFSDSGAEYKIEALRESQRQRLVDFLVQRFDGRVDAARTNEFSAVVRVGAQTVSVHEVGFYIGPSGSYFPGQPEDPQVQRAFVQRLGEAFDAELASGRLDHLFADPTPAAAR